jgi:hypothetical protein
VGDELCFYIPEDDILHSHGRENLNSYIFSIYYSSAGADPRTENYLLGPNDTQCGYSWPVSQVMRTSTVSQRHSCESLIRNQVKEPISSLLHQLNFKHGRGKPSAMLRRIASVSWYRLEVSEPHQRLITHANYRSTMQLPVVAFATRDTIGFVCYEVGYIDWHMCPLIAARRYEWLHNRTSGWLHRVINNYN